MKLIIVNGGVAECDLNGQIGVLQMLGVLEDLYKIIPNASIYLDIGNGAQFINPHNPCIVLNKIQPSTFTINELKGTS